nr:unnamed protein product [Callosobruchus chinensis]
MRVQNLRIGEYSESYLIFRRAGRYVARTSSERQRV